MFCASCGKQNPDDSKFCESCGSPLGDAVVKAAPVAAAAAYTPPPSPAPQPQPVYQPPVAPQQPVYAAPPQQTYYQQSQQPVYNNAAANGGAKVMTIGDYILTFIVTAIPIVGFIMLLVWAFGSDTNPNKKNYCRAILILMVVGIILSIIFSIVFAGLFATIFDNGDWNFNY